MSIRCLTSRTHRMCRVGASSACFTNGLPTFYAPRSGLGFFHASQVVLCPPESKSFDTDVLCPPESKIVLCPPESKSFDTEHRAHPADLPAHVVLNTVTLILQQEETAPGPQVAELLLVHSALLAASSTAILLVRTAPRALLQLLCLCHRYRVINPFLAKNVAVVLDSFPPLTLSLEETAAVAAALIACGEYRQYVAEYVAATVTSLATMRSKSSVGASHSQLPRLSQGETFALFSAMECHWEGTFASTARRMRPDCHHPADESILGPALCHVALSAVSCAPLHTLAVALRATAGLSVMRTPYGTIPSLLRDLTAADGVEHGEEQASFTSTGDLAPPDSASPSLHAAAAQQLRLLSIFCAAARRLNALRSSSTPMAPEDIAPLLSDGSPCSEPTLPAVLACVYPSLATVASCFSQWLASPQHPQIQLPHGLLEAAGAAYAATAKPTFEFVSEVAALCGYNLQSDMLLSGIPVLTLRDPCNPEFCESLILADSSAAAIDDGSSVIFRGSVATALALSRYSPATRTHLATAANPWAKDRREKDGSPQKRFYTALSYQPTVLYLDLRLLALRSCAASSPVDGSSEPIGINTEIPSYVAAQFSEGFMKVYQTRVASKAPLVRPSDITPLLDRVNSMSLASGLPGDLCVVLYSLD